MTRCMLVGRCVACWPAPQTSCLRLRPAGSPEALVSAPRMPKACPRLRPASADQPPGRPYWPYRPRFRHSCRPSRGFAEQPTSTTTTIAAPSTSGMSRLPSGSSSTGSGLSHGQAAASPTWYRIRMRVRVGVSDPAAHAGKHSVHGRAVSRYPNDTACTIELGGRAAVSAARGLFGGEGAQTKGAELPTT